MIPVWQAEVKNGKLTLKDKDMFNMFLSTLEGSVQLVVSKPRKQRSGQQNRYYHGVVVKLISDHTGYSPEETHELIKIQFNSKVVNVGGKEITIGLSTAAISTLEFEQMISRVVQWASFKLGLIIPDPEKVMGYN